MKALNFLLPLGFAFLLGVPVLGQSYQMSISSGSGAPGDSLDLSILLDNNGNDIQGWNYGACHNSSALSLTGVIEGSTTEVVNNGSPPDFHGVAVYAAEGFTVGVVVCFTGCANLPAGTTGAELDVASYNLIGGPATTTIVDFCDTLGNPIVETAVVVAGASVTPEQQGGTVTIEGCTGDAEPPTNLSCEVVVSGGCECLAILNWQSPATIVSGYEVYLNGVWVQNLFPSESTLVLSLSDFNSATLCIRSLCEPNGGIPSSLVCCTVECPLPVDCNANGIPDFCDLESGFLDCNSNGELDECEINQGSVPDCNLNGIIDECEFNPMTDCNANGVLDDCDISNGLSDDCNGNALPDECENDCDGNGVADECDLPTNDCNSNGLVDVCEVLSGAVADCNENNVPDSCDFVVDPDCNTNGILDECDIILGISLDCDSNLVPDECDLAGGAADVDGNEIPDVCEGSLFVRGECNEDGAVDIGDSVFLLSFLFTSGVEPNCMDTADTNDDSSIDIGDAVYLLAFLFSFGPEPAEPFFECGLDSSKDNLDCESYGACP